jgi:hypothetical protein
MAGIRWTFDLSPNSLKKDHLSGDPQVVDTLRTTMVIKLCFPRGSLLAVLALLSAFANCHGALRGGRNSEPADHGRELQLQGRLTGMQLVRTDTDVPIKTIPSCAA